MPLPSFTIDPDATIFDILGVVSASELDPAVLTSATVVFRSNVPENRFVVWDGDLYRVPPVTARVTADGIRLSDNSPVQLLANDAGLSVEDLQWEVDVRIPEISAASGRNISGVTRIKSMRKWWITAPADGSTLNLATTAPAPGLDVAPTPTNLTVAHITDAGATGRDVLEADTQADARAAIGAISMADVVDGAPATLDTLNELSAALGDDANFATTVTNSLADKERKVTINVKDSPYSAVGDGVADDTTAVQAALTAANTAGGATVLLPRGTYLISSELTMGGNKVTLQGMGRSATVIKTVGDHAVIRGNSASGLCIRDLQLLGDADALKTSQMGIRTHNVTDSLIHNVHVKDIGYDGICLLQNSVRNVVSNCLVENCQDDGVNVGGNTGTGSTENVVAGNTIHGCGHTGVHLSTDSSFTTVVGNTIYDCDTGIDTHQPVEQAGLGNHTISGNSVRDCVSFGIEIFNADNNIVIGNNISGTERGIKATNSSYSQFVGNRVNNTSIIGFNDDADCSDLTVANNVFTGASAGVSALSPRTIITSNRVQGVTTTTYSIQCASGATDSVISNNLVIGGTVIGINALGAGCVISGNRVLAGTVGITVGGADNQVASNYVTGTTSHGIQVNGADCLVASNVLRSTGNHGVWVNAATRAQIVDNHFRAAAGWSINILAGVDTYVANNVTVSSTTGSLQANAASSGTIAAHNRFDSTVTLNDTTAVRREITNPTGTAALDFGSVAAQSFADLTLTVTGAVAGDSVALGVPTAAITAGIAYTAWVSASNTVTVRAHNYTAGALDPASGSFKATVVR